MLNRYGKKSLLVPAAAGVRVFAPGISESALAGATLVYLRPGMVEAITVNVPDTVGPPGVDVIELYDQATVTPSSPPTTGYKERLRPWALAGGMSFDIPVGIEFQQGILIVCNTVVTAEFTVIYRCKGRTAPAAPGVFIARR